MSQAAPTSVFVTQVRHNGHGHGEVSAVMLVTESFREALEAARRADKFGYKPRDTNTFTSIWSMRVGDVCSRPHHSAGQCYPIIYARRPHPFNQGEIPQGWTEEFFLCGKRDGDVVSIDEAEAFRVFGGGKGVEIPPEPR